MKDKKSKRKTTWITEENHQKIRLASFQERVTFFEYLNAVLDKFFEKK